MANVLFKKGLLKNLPTEKVAGTIYVTTDERAMYLDVDASTRIRLGDFNEIPDLNALPDVSHEGGTPNPTGLYYSIKENVLARYDSANKKWAQINPDNWFELKDFTQTLTSNTANGTTTVQVVSKIEQVNENNQSGGRHGSQYNSILKFKDGGSVTISTEGTTGSDGVTTLDTIKISATDQSVLDAAHHYKPSGAGTLVSAETDSATGNTFITGVKTDAAGHVVKVTKKAAVIDKVSNAQLTSTDETAGAGETSAVKLNFSIDHGTPNAAADKIRIAGAGATTVTHSADKETIQISSTDQSVSDAAHHYTPTAVPGSKIEVGSRQIISEIQRDDKGHVTGIDTIDENKVSTVTMTSGSTTGGVSIATTVNNARGGSPAGNITLKGSGDTTITSTDSGASVTIETHDTKVTSAANHYKAKKTTADGTPTTTDIAAGTYKAIDSASKDPEVDNTAAKAKTPVVTGVTIDAAGHVTGVTAIKIADTHAGLETAELKAQASGWQLNVVNTDKSAATGTFDPTINYGKNKDGNTTQTVHGLNGAFTLDTYTTGEVDAKITTAIQATGAMVLKGELTSAKSLPTTNVAAGDTYIVTTDKLKVAGNVCEIGDLFVAKADMASGSTNDNWYYVPSGNDKHIIIGKEATGTVGAVLIDGNETASAEYGSINFNSVAKNSPSGIIATKVENTASLGAKDVSFTFSMEWGSF